MKMNIAILLYSSYPTCCQSYTSLSYYRVEQYRLILHRYLSHVRVICGRTVVNYRELWYCPCVTFLYFTRKQLETMSFWYVLFITSKTWTKFASIRLSGMFNSKISSRFNFNSKRVAQIRLRSHVK